MSESFVHATPTRIPTAEELGFDPGALREKYAAERAKRLRAEGNNHFPQGDNSAVPLFCDPIEQGFALRLIRVIEPL
jgi:hypothetical protein